MNTKQNINFKGFGNSTKKVPQVTKMTFQEVQQVASEKAESLKMWGVKAFKVSIIIAFALQLF